MNEKLQYLKLNDKIVDILKDYHDSLNAVLEDAKVKVIEFATEIQNKNADEIVVIANGQIRAFGPREEILPTLLSDEKTGRCPINAKGVEY